MDNEFTERLSTWLNTPKSERDVADGAMLLLRLNNNRYLYANILRRPDKMADKLEYELRKHLRIRLDGLTRGDVVRLEAQVIPSAKETLSSPPTVVSTDAELAEARVVKGRRADHDTLPPSVQALWEGNLQLYKTIKNVFEQLKTMEHAQPCDRYEYLKILDEADRKYRSNLAQYDNFVADGEPVASATDNSISDEAQRKINAARKTLSKYKKILAKARGDIDGTAMAREKIIACIATIRENGGVVGDAVRGELNALGIVMVDHAEA
jgi:hypothetical protein